MANQYSDLFTYGVFGGIQDWCTVSYKNVTLLKELCGKKAGTVLDEIRLNTCKGTFTVPRVQKKKPVAVEFKGTHTRFEDDEPEEAPAPAPAPEKKKRVTKKEETIFKVYEGRKIHTVSEFDDEAYEIVTDAIADMLEVMKSKFSVDAKGCIVMCGIWEQFELKKRFKAGKYSFARIK